MVHYPKLTWYTTPKEDGILESREDMAIRLARAQHHGSWKQAHRTWSHYVAETTDVSLTHAYRLAKWGNALLVHQAQGGDGPTPSMRAASGGGLTESQRAVRRRQAGGWWVTDHRARKHLDAVYPFTRQPQWGPVPLADMAAKAEWVEGAADDDERRRRLAEMREMWRGYRRTESATLGLAR